MAAKPVRGVPNISAKAWFALKAYESAPSDMLAAVSGDGDLPSWVNALNSLCGLAPLPPFEVCVWGGGRFPARQGDARALRAGTREKIFSPGLS